MVLRQRSKEEKMNPTNQCFSPMGSDGDSLKELQPGGIQSTLLRLAQGMPHTQCSSLLKIGLEKRVWLKAQIVPHSHHCKV